MRRQREERPVFGAREARRRLLAGALGLGPATAVRTATVVLVEVAAVTQTINGPEDTG